MKLAVSNIAWDTAASEVVYGWMRQYGFTGLEIAPTKFFEEEPYSGEHIMGVQTLATVLKKAFHLSVVSMQSIWFGRSESIFGMESERKALIQYTARAVDFAAAAGCGNLVFGCPRNRNLPAGAEPALADSFFTAIADYALQRDVMISLEPNPPIYNTNFLNTTAETAAYLRRLGHPALGLNLDLGTVQYNGETPELITENLDLIRHIHISNPNLTPVQALPLHTVLADVLRRGGYTGWVSIEMKDAGLPALKTAMEAVSKEFLCE